jgi:hypothetical protein
MQYLLRAPYGKEISTIGKGIMIAELARIDAGLATFVTVQYCDDLWVAGLW